MNHYHHTEAQRVEAEQFGMVMQGLRATQLGAVFAVLTVCAISWNYASPAAIGIWLALWCVLAVSRYLVWRRYDRVIRTQSVPHQLAFARRQRWIWCAYAISWGAAALVFAGRLPEKSEIACWLLIATIGAVAMSWMAAHVPTVRGFLLTLIVSVTVCVAANTVTSSHPLAAAVPSLAMTATVLLLWIVLLGTAGRLHRLAARGIDLHCSNQTLIESLRTQTSAAQEALQFRGRYLASAAHDLRQPVNALGIYAQWLRDEPHMADELAVRILRSTQAINAQFDSLFNLARLDIGQLQANARAVDLNNLLTEIEAQFRPFAVQKGLTLRLRPLHVSINSDPVMLRRILSNLVSNAIRYTQRGGVLLAARKRGDAISLEVWDTGIGIAPDEHENIFGEFYRVRTEADDGSLGLGLGLSIAHRLAGSLGCRLTLHSRLGRGTVFKLLVNHS